MREESLMSPVGWKVDCACGGLHTFIHSFIHALTQHLQSLFALERVVSCNVVMRGSTSEIVTRKLSNKLCIEVGELKGA